MHKFGDIILTEVQFADSYEVKTRPALVLFQEQGNVVVAGITSNIKMQGVPLRKEEGAVKDSIIKLNYLFTISERMIKKYLFSLKEEKKDLIKRELIKKIQ